MAQLKDLLVTGPARFLSKTVFSSEVDINNKVNLKDDVDIDGDVTIDGEIFSGGSITANGNITSIGDNTFTGKNVFKDVSNTYNTEATKKFIVGNDSSAFVFGGDGLQCFSGINSTTGKIFYMNFYGGPVQIGDTGQTDALTIYRNTSINGALQVNALSGDTPAYLKSASTGSYLGYKNSSGATLGFLGYSGANAPIAYYNNKAHQIFNGGASATFEAGSTQAATPALKWGAINSKNPYFGYASDQTDGTFLWSITGTNYQSGLAIGGGTGKLLWKGKRVSTTDNNNAVGSATKPIYMNADGEAAACTYKLEANVPADAKFTDTTYSNATTSAAGLMSAADKSKLNDMINWFKIGTPISSSSTTPADLDNYTTIGKYAATTEAIAKTILNCPTKTNFVLFVFDRTTSGVLTQMIIDLNGKMHVRSASSSGWREWEKYATTAGDTFTGDVTFNGSKSIFNTQAWFYKNPVIEKSTSIADDSPARLTFQVHQTDNDITTAATISAYDDGDAATNGTVMVIQSSGGVIIGGGESPASAYTDVKANMRTAENLYLTADNHIRFYSNANTYSNKKEGYFNSKGQFEVARAQGCSWYQGKDNAGFVMSGTGSGAYIPMLSQTTTNGSMQLGHYNSSNWHDYWTFIYTKSSATTNSDVVYGPKIYGPTGVLYGAAWNDYAEFRNSTEEVEPGRIVCENGDDTVSISTERLQPGALATSDTYGFAIGETEESKCPIAVAGRVLVFPYEDRNSYKPGDPVCAAPGGTVSKMTREEVVMYPDRIIGTVSAIPNYDTWGAINTPVKNRIWIKI